MTRTQFFQVRIELYSWEIKNWHTQRGENRDVKEEMTPWKYTKRYVKKKKPSLDLLQIPEEVTWISNDNTFKNKQQTKVSVPLVSWVCGEDTNLVKWHFGRI